MNQKLEKILPNVEKPARYTGGEYNSVVKTNRDELVKFAFAFPDVYEVGMSHMGLRILYDIINARQDACCERVFAPWMDMEKAMRENHIPLWTLESGEPVKSCDILGFTLQYEMSYSNILNMLDLSGIPLRCAERGEDDPIVIAGGPCAYNPEPLAGIIDLFSLGDGEDITGETIQCYKECREKGMSRAETIQTIALEVDGIYAPAFYDVEYYGDGRIKSYTPNLPGIKDVITKRFVLDMNTAPFPEKPIVPFLDIVHDRVSLEVFRGCTRGCRFCQAGMVYRPVREKTVDTIVKQAADQINNSGYDEISLSSLSTGDYSQFSDLLKALKEGPCGGQQVISLPSLRLDAFAKEYMDSLEGGRKAGLTLAPEAGTQRLRDIINKNVTEDDLYQSVGYAFEKGWNRVKLYFMIGLPGETDEDLDGIVNLARNLGDLYLKLPKEKRRRPLELTISTSNFVPKPFTPFQWCAQNTPEELDRKHKYLREKLKLRGVRFTYAPKELSRMEAIFAKGDRRLSEVLIEAFKNGARMDGWKEFFSYERYCAAFETCGLDMNFYANRAHEADEIFPWDHVSVGVSKTYLRKEYERSLQALTTPDCRGKCNGCGLEKICRMVKR